MNARAALARPIVSDRVYNYYINVWFRRFLEVSNPNTTTTAAAVSDDDDVLRDGQTVSARTHTHTHAHETYIGTTKCCIILYYSFSIM